MSDRYRKVLLDTGPLVAILDRNDSAHESCVTALSKIEPPLHCCWAVLTEAAWLLRSTPAAIQAILRREEDTFFTLIDVLQNQLPQIALLHQQYSDLSPQLADLTLLYLALRDDCDTNFTLDRRDFTVFRRRGNQPFTLLPDMN